MNDHRRLGRELGLFDTDPLMGAGLPYWLPDGAAVRYALEEYVRDAERRAGYRHVYSPVLGKKELYEISGHWSHYGDDMFPPMELGGEQMLLRPSLCPHHALIYRSRPHSYRELPFRMAELGAMYRSEPSGVLGGLTRVRAIQLNDAHIFCTSDQVAEEASAALGLIRDAYDAMGIAGARYRLSLPGPGGKYVADPELWRRSAALLREVLDGSGVAYEAVEGEAAFYGPKIDVQITDPAGREATLSTVQVDFHQPERFDLHYIGADGEKHRPVMVHRSVIGSLERTVAHLSRRPDRPAPARRPPPRSPAGRRDPAPHRPADRIPQRRSARPGRADRADRLSSRGGGEPPGPRPTVRATDRATAHAERGPGRSPRRVTPGPHTDGSPSTMAE
ncbi:aminoacyl--tRNA ligase-related protein [Streptomyces sp. NPDC005784]|uniref:aminoacyl--tRNA ligase-related protein n=1 Tax=Streptomyces sp. NPDC005784 TaxID=3364731 RepID=UPI0036CCD7A5